VEDEGIVAEDIRARLQELDYEVCSVVSTGTEAIRHARRHRPDLILMDVVLHDAMDGIEAAQEIRKILNIPIIYLTAYADDEILERAKITEPFGYLIKPFQDRELHSAIEIALYKHRLDTELRQSREWSSVILNSIGDAVIATDREGRVMFMNPPATVLTGCEESEAKGVFLSQAFLATDLDGGAAIGDLLSEAADDARVSFSGTIKTRRASTVQVEGGAAPIRDADSAVIGVVLVLRDVTESKRATERLRLLSQAVEQTSEGIAIVDLEGNIIFLNKAFAAMHGCSPEEVVGLNLAIFHRREHMAEVEAANDQIRTTGDFCGEVPHARTDGSVFPGLMHNSLLRDPMGNPIGMIGTLRDITEIKKVEADLRGSHEKLAAYSSSLEAKVAERTRDLEKSRAELEIYSESLEKTNEALKIIIEGIEQQRKDAEKKITYNLNLTVRPILEQLKAQNTSETLQFLLKSLEFNLRNIFSSFEFDMMKDGHLLTPREIRICEMIRSGLSSKQIAQVMGISAQTVLVHRKNIRKKLSLAKSRKNLASFLKANPM